MRTPRFLMVPRSPDFTIGNETDPYLRRWYVIPHNKGLNIYLHNFCRSDDPRANHDHPWANCSIILRGMYFEHLQNGHVVLRRPWRPWAPWRVVVRRATSAHRVELIQGIRPVWTLFLTGPKIREWGFHCPRGWMHWRDFVAVRPGGNSIGAGCDSDPTEHTS